MPTKTFLPNKVNQFVTSALSPPAENIRKRHVVACNATALPICSQCTLSLPPEMFSGDKERVHWEQMD